jgi:pimeloyl-ACP methyl ester carboxylesterase
MRKYILLTLNIACIMGTANAQGQPVGNYANVNGIKMYYEVQGDGQPLVLLHGGGSTITTSFGRIMPELAKTHRVIAVELQAHGHTGDRNTPETFAQDADDVAELLKQLGIMQADLLGFSNGGQTLLEIALRHPSIVRRMIVASAFYSKAGAPDGFWKGFGQPKFSDMPQVYKDAFLKVNNDTAALMNMFHKDVQRMAHFTGWKADEIKSIQAPTLVVGGDRDIVLPEHAVEMSRLLPHGRLAILPGTHGQYLGETATATPNSKVPDLFVEMVNEFLKGS